MPIHYLRQAHGPHEHGVAVMTRGPELHFQNGNLGSTGSWAVGANRVHVGDTVIIYHRTANGNNVYKAKCIEISSIRRNRGLRQRFNLDEGHFVGITQENWMIFANTGTNPVKYF